MQMYLLKVYFTHVSLIVLLAIVYIYIVYLHLVKYMNTSVTANIG